MPQPHPEVAALHQWIEFGNRLFVGLVGLVGLACLIVSLLVRPRRRRLILLAATMPAGVVGQAVLGGVTVLTGLTWWTVAVHFLVSMVLVWLAVLLVAAFAEDDTPPRWHLPRPLRGLLYTATAVLAALLIAGTLVTSAGPHAGDSATPRLPISVPALAQLHADLLVGFLGLLTGLGFALRAVGVPDRTWRRYPMLVCVVLAQGTLGIVQYLTGVPEVLVSLHVLGAALVVVAMAALWTSCRVRDGRPAVTVGRRIPADVYGRAHG
jgi:cytochrome c oxidase assembly protein subunit 15